MALRHMLSATGRSRVSANCLALSGWFGHKHGINSVISAMTSTTVALVLNRRRMGMRRERVLVLSYLPHFCLRELECLDVAIIATVQTAWFPVIVQSVIETLVIVSS